MSDRARVRVLQARFELSAPDLERAPPGDRPEFAFVGRSNVGKSSLINALTGRRGLARTSRTPGRTQLLNFFAVQVAAQQRSEQRWADLPGYGFAAAHRQIRERFAPMIERYLAERDSLVALVLLVDVRRGLDDRDVAVVEFAGRHGRPTLLVGTKADKLGKAQRGLVRRRLADDVGVLPADVVLTSASEGWGLHDADGLLDDLVRLALRPEGSADGDA